MPLYNVLVSKPESKERMMGKVLEAKESLTGQVLEAGPGYDSMWERDYYSYTYWSLETHRREKGFVDGGWHGKVGDDHSLWSYALWEEDRPWKGDFANVDKELLPQVTEEMTVYEAGFRLREAITKDEQEQRRREYEESQPYKGRVVQVVKGRKVPKGIVGYVFWYREGVSRGYSGNNRWSDGRSARIGIEVSKNYPEHGLLMGQRLFLSAGNVKVLQAEQAKELTKPVSYAFLNDEEGMTDGMESDGEESAEEHMPVSPVRRDAMGKVAWAIRKMRSMPDSDVSGISRIVAWVERNVQDQDLRQVFHRAHMSHVGNDDADEDNPLSLKQQMEALGVA
jgi:hypothetical protein